jgi:WD40 repeat protein
MITVMMLIIMMRVCVLVQERKARKVFYGHSGIVNCLAHSAGLLFTGSADFTIKSWNPTGVIVLTFSGHQASVTALEPGPNNTLFSGSSDETIRQWDIKARRRSLAHSFFSFHILRSRGSCCVR